MALGLGGGWSLNRDRTMNPRELDVLALIAEGWGNQEIAKIVGIQRESVENVVHAIYKKLDVEARGGVCSPRVCAVLFYFKRPDPDHVTQELTVPVLPKHDHLRFGEPAPLEDVVITWHN